MEIFVRNTKIILTPEANVNIPCYSWFVNQLSNNNWEPETFELFNNCSDADATALDIGAWIGATTIFLSQKFKNVIAIEADKNAITAFRQNIADNRCSNVNIIEAAIYNEGSRKIFFGRNPKGENLGDSMSQARNTSTFDDDYEIETITLKQIIDTYTNYNIKFVKVDIEGGEENILEDLFSWGQKFNWKVLLSFHYGWWANRDTTRFKNLLRLLKIVKFNHKEINPEELFDYVKNHHFGSFYLEF